MRFIWGYIYVAFGVIDAALKSLGVYVLFRGGQVAVGLGLSIVIAIYWVSLYGILRRRRWGLILTSILLGLMIVTSLWPLWRAIREVTWLPGYFPMAILAPALVFLYSLFFFVYFLRRRKFFA